MRKALYITCLAAITSISIFLRVYDFDRRVTWMGDTARDLLVAKHILMYREFPKVGPAASGSLTPYGSYPPFYFYMIAAASTVFSEPLTLMRATAVIHGLMTPVIAIIGISVCSPLSGILAALLYAISARMINASLIFQSAFTVLIPFYMGIACLSIGKGRTGWRLAGYLLLAMASIIHYSALMALPIIITVDAIICRQFRKTAILAICPLAFIFLAFLPNFIFYGFDNVLSNFMPFKYFSLQQAGNGRLPAFIRQLGNDIFMDGYRTMIGLALTIGIIVLQGKSGWKKFAPILIPLSLIICITILKSGTLVTHYVTFTIPGFFLTVASATASVVTRKRLFAVVGLLLYALFAFAISDSFKYLAYAPDDYGRAVRIAEMLTARSHEYTGTDIGNIIVTWGSKDSTVAWESPSLWYNLEDQLNKPLVHVINGGPSLEYALYDKPWIALLSTYSKTDYPGIINELVGDDNPSHIIECELPPPTEDIRMFLLTPRQKLEPYVGDL